MTVFAETLKEKLEILINSPYVAAHSIPIYAASINELNSIFLTQLNTVINQSNNSQELAQALKELLKNNWSKIQSTALCYTAQSDSPITELCCDIATFVAQQLGLPAINVLMPTVSVDSINPGTYSHLDEVDDLKNIVKTHIIGQQGLYLIPVKCIAEYDERVGFQPIANPYYDTFNRNHNEAMVYLSQDEINRLIEHSNLTKNIFNTKNEFENLANDQDNLLGQLRYLCGQMYYNSVNGIGQEEISGNMVSLAIFNFLTYYDGLEKSHKNRVPSSVKSEIEAIRNYAANKSMNTDIYSCLAIRRKELLASMRGNEELLSSIGLSKDPQATRVQAVKTRLQEARNTLLTTIEENNYHEGADKLPMPIHLIRESKQEIRFSEFKDLDILKMLSGSEIRDICCNPIYRDSIVGAIGSTENLVDLVRELSLEQLGDFLKSLEPTLSNRFIAYGSRYAAVTASLDEKRRDIFWQQHKAKAAAVNPFTIQYVFDHLNEWQQTEFINLVEEKIRVGDIDCNYEDFLDLVKDLKPELRVQLFKAFKDRTIANQNDNLMSPGELKRFYDNLEAPLCHISSYGSTFLEFSMWVYAVEFLKITSLPAIKKHGFSPYESSSAFFTAAVAPVTNFGLALEGLCWVLGYLLESLIFLLAGRPSFSFEDANKALYYTCYTIGYAAIAVITIPAILTRLISTSGAAIFGTTSEPEPTAVDEVASGIMPV